MKPYLIIIFVLFANIVNAQSWKNVSVLGDTIGQPEALMTDGNNLYMISYNNKEMVLTKSTDKGFSWFTQYRKDTYTEFGNILLVRNAVLVDSTYIYVNFFDYHKIGKSTDGGKTFEVIDFGPGDSFYQLCMYNRNIGVAMSEYYLYVTDDGWKTNRKIQTKFRTIYYNPIFIDKDNVQFKADSDNVKILINFNLVDNRWYVYSTFSADNKDVFLDLQYTENGLGFIPGLLRNGNGDRATDKMYQSTDYGKSWTKTIDKDVEPQWGIENVRFNDTLNGFATGQFGKILMTNNGGKSWDYVNNLDFYVAEDTSYGPFTTDILWMNDKPYIMSGFRNLYSIETNYFKIYDKHNIYGKVTNEGKPIDASLRNGKKVNFTYEDGTYRFKKLHKGKYTITPEPNDYYTIAPESIDVDIGDQDETADFEATRKQFRLEGKVVNNPNANKSDFQFEISCESLDGNAYKLDTLVGISDLDNFVFDKLNAVKNLKIKSIVNNSDYIIIPSEKSIDLIQDTVINYEILKKDENFTISGRFYSNGKGIGEIGILLLTGAKKQLTFTDNDGNYRFYDNQAGECYIFVTSVFSGFGITTPEYYHFNLDTHKENMDFEMEIWNYYRLRGRVTDRNGRGVPNIRILPFSDGKKLYTDTFAVRTRADGRYTSMLLDEKDGLPGFPLTLSLENQTIYTPKYNYITEERGLNGYDFVIDTVLSDVPYRINEPVGIYPNPASSTLHVDLSEVTQFPLRLSIVDIEGNIVSKNKEYSSSSLDLDIGNLATGTYFLQIEYKNGIVDRQKFVKK